MKFTTPLPQPLPQECTKATKILRSFLTTSRTGPDKVIPRQILQNAKGFAIFTVMKAGFVFSARAGSGIVIAKLDDGSWSAPSAIGTAGMGFGGQAGAELTEFLVVLNSKSAVRSFMSAGSLQLGGNMSLAVGPLGRTGEASGSLNTKGKVAAMYSYSKTKGLFGGVSLEGSIIVERQDANAIAYNADVTSKQLLNGNVPAPHWANGLVQVLQECTGDVRGWVDEERPASGGERPPLGEYTFSGMGSTSSAASSDSHMKRKKSLSISSSLGQASWNKNRKSVVDDDYFSPSADRGGSSQRYDDMRHVGNGWGKDKKRPSSPTETSYNAPYKPPNLMDDSDSDDPWGDKPVPSKSSTAPKFLSTPQPPANSQFPVHFDSDFSGDATAISRPPQKHFRTQSIPPPAPVDPFPDLNSSLNAFSFSSNAPALYSLQPRASSPAKTQMSMYDWAWRDNHANRTAAAASSPSPDAPSFGDSDDGISTPRSSFSHSSKPVRSLSTKRGLLEPAPPGTTKAIALFDYAAKEPGDLSFHKGDIIYVLEKTETTNSWWKGRLAGEYAGAGIFPANFVSLNV